MDLNEEQIKITYIMDRIEKKLKEVNLLEAWRAPNTGWGFQNSNIELLEHKWDKFKEEEKEIIVKGFDRLVELVKECRENNYHRNTPKGILRIKLGFLLGYICKYGLNYLAFSQDSVIPDLQALICQNPL